MNYLAHGRNWLDDPYVVAGTAVPDWLAVSDRPVRARAKHCAPLCENADPRVAAIARGIVQHHADDAWFHATRAFAELSLGFAAAIRRFTPEDDSPRAGFLGHVLVELLLDHALAEEDATLLPRYYRAIAAVDASAVAAVVELAAGSPPERLARFIGLFQSEAFLWDYGDDAKLCRRLNQVMNRVRLPAVPEKLPDLLPGFRRQVSERRAELLTPDE